MNFEQTEDILFHRINIKISIFTSGGVATFGVDERNKIRSHTEKIKSSVSYMLRKLQYFSSFVKQWKYKKGDCFSLKISFVLFSLFISFRNFYI